MTNPFSKVLSVLTGGLVDQVGGLIDGISTTEEEKLAAKAELQKIANQAEQAAMAHTEAIASYQRDAVVAEAESQHWLAANWRPILMLVFAFIVAWNYALVPILGAFTDAIVAATIPPDMWDLLKIGVGGYIVGRSAEKIVPRMGRR